MTEWISEHFSEHFHDGVRHRWQAKRPYPSYAVKVCDWLIGFPDSRLDEHRVREIYRSGVMRLAAITDARYLPKGVQDFIRGPSYGKTQFKRLTAEISKVRYVLVELSKASPPPPPAISQRLSESASVVECVRFFQALRAISMEFDLPASNGPPTSSDCRSGDNFVVQHDYMVALRHLVDWAMDLPRLLASDIRKRTDVAIFGKRYTGGGLPNVTLDQLVATAPDLPLKLGIVATWLYHRLAGLIPSTWNNIAAFDLNFDITIQSTDGEILTALSEAMNVAGDVREDLREGKLIYVPPAEDDEVRATATDGEGAGIKERPGEMGAILIASDIAILRALSKSNGAMKLDDLAQAADLHRDTCSDRLGPLIKWGFAARRSPRTGTAITPKGRSALNPR